MITVLLSLSLLLSGAITPVNQPTRSMLYYISNNISVNHNVSYLYEISYTIDNGDRITTEYRATSTIEALADFIPYHPQNYNNYQIKLIK